MFLAASGPEFEYSFRTQALFFIKARLYFYLPGTPCPKNGEVELTMKRENSTIELGFIYKNNQGVRL